MTANDPTDEDYDGFWKVMEGDPTLAREACIEALAGMDEDE